MGTYDTRGGHPLSPEIEDPPCDRCGGDPAECCCYAERPYEALSNDDLETQYVYHRRWAEEAWGENDVDRANELCRMADAMLDEISRRKPLTQQSYSPCSPY